MMHVEFDELLRLAEASTNQEGFDDIQMEHLEHLKRCRDCYESFCLLSALTDMMSESGSYMLNKNEAAASVNETAKAIRTKVLAKFQVVRNTAVNAFGAVLEQIDQAASLLQFGPSLAMATRGVGKADTTIIRLEEFEDEKTYIVFNPETNEIAVQVNVRGMDIENLHVYIEFADSSKIEMPVTKKGTIVKGTMSNLKKSDFCIVIEVE